MSDFRVKICDRDYPEPYQVLPGFIDEKDRPIKYCPCCDEQFTERQVEDLKTDDHGLETCSNCGHTELMDCE